MKENSRICRDNGAAFFWPDRFRRKERRTGVTTAAGLIKGGSQKGFSRYELSKRKKKRGVTAEERTAAERHRTGVQGKKERETNKQQRIVYKRYSRKDSGTSCIETPAFHQRGGRNLQKLHYRLNREGLEGGTFRWGNFPATLAVRATIRNRRRIEERKWKGGNLRNAY